MFPGLTKKNASKLSVQPTAGQFPEQRHCGNDTNAAALGSACVTPCDPSEHGQLQPRSVRRGCSVVITPLDGRSAAGV